jgi:hypothetical protein
MINLSVFQSGEFQIYENFVAHQFSIFVFANAWTSRWSWVVQYIPSREKKTRHPSLSERHIFFFFCIFFPRQSRVIFSALSRFNFRSYESIHESYTLKKRERRASPFLHHHWQCPATNSVHASHLGCLESISIRLSSVCCGYSSLCCNHCVHRGAAVLDHGMNTLHVSPVAFVGASLQELSYLLPPIANDVQPPRNSSIWWVISAHPFIQKHHDTFWKCSSNHEIKLHCYHILLSYIPHLGCQVARPYTRSELTWTLKIRKI